MTQSTKLIEKLAEDAEDLMASLPDKRNLWERICAVREDVQPIHKDKTIGYGSSGYKVATHEAVKEKLRPMMVKHGLVDWLEEENYERVDTGVRMGSSKRPVIRHQGRYTYCVRSVREDSDVLRIQVRGDAEDPGDKGPGKASTYALKTGQRIVFMLVAPEISEEDRIDDSAVEENVAAMSPDQIDKLHILADDLFGDRADEMISRMLEKIFGVKALADVPAAHYQHAEGLLRNAHKREQEKSNAE